MQGELDFSGKTVLVTGSSRNLGKTILLEFASRGANVIVNTRSNREDAEQVASEARAFGVEAAVVLGMPSEKSTIDALYAEAESRFGGVDICVSNAARRLFKTFDETTDEDWHFYLNQQLTASWYLAKAFAPGMKAKRWGRILHINGADGYRGGGTRIPHSTAKAALRTLTKCLAVSLGEFGITVNDVSPGLMDTVRDPETHPQLFNSEFMKNMLDAIPIGRQPTPEELAWACVFLCSPRSASITGSVIHVDGGQGRLG